MNDLMKELLLAEVSKAKEDYINNSDDYYRGVFNGIETIFAKIENRSPNHITIVSSVQE